MRTVIGGASTIGVTVERVLRYSHLTAGRIEYLRSAVDKRTPGVVHTGTHAATESFFHAGLHRVIDGGRCVGAESNYSLTWIGAAVVSGRRSATRQARIAVQRLEQCISFRADI